MPFVPRRAVPAGVEECPPQDTRVEQEGRRAPQVKSGRPAATAADLTIRTAGPRRTAMLLRAGVQPRRPTWMTTTATAVAAGLRSGRTGEAAHGRPTGSAGGRAHRLARVRFRTGPQQPERARISRQQPGVPTVTETASCRRRREAERTRREQRRRDRRRGRSRRFDDRVLPGQGRAGRPAAGEDRLPAREGLRRRPDPACDQAARRDGHRHLRGGRLAAQQGPAHHRRRRPPPAGLAGPRLLPRLRPRPQARRLRRAAGPPGAEGGRPAVRALQRRCARSSTTAPAASPASTPSSGEGEARR